MNSDFKVGTFGQQEAEIQKEFLSKFDKEVDLFNKLLEVYESFLDATTGQLKDTDSPNWTILLLLSQTLPLMNNAIELLSKGYLRSSEILVRIAGEAIILSIIFKEYPKIEKEYKKLNHNVFFRKYRIKNKLSDIQKKGKYFSPKGRKDNIYEIIYTNLYSEANRFLHQDIDAIYGVMKSYQTDKEDKHIFVKGPQLFKDETLSMAIRRLFNTLLFSLVVLGISLSIWPDENERKIMDKSSQTIDKLGLKGSNR